MKIAFKSILIFLEVVIIMIFFNSCGNNNAKLSEKIGTKITEYIVENFSKTKEERLADASMANIKKCIDKKDAEAFKKLFSNNVIKSEENLDQQIEEMFDLLPNGIVEYSQTSDGGVSDGWEKGHEYYKITREFIVSDGVQQYVFVLDECIKDTANKDDIGIKSIWFYKTDDEELFSNWFLNIYKGGNIGIIIYNRD